MINQKGLLQYFEMIKGISGVVFSVIALLMYHWSLLAVTIFSVAIMLAIPKLFKQKVELAGLNATKANELFVNKTENILFGFSIFYNFSKIPLMAKQIVQASKELKTTLIEQSKIESLVFTLGFFANIFFQIALTAYTGYLAFKGIVPIGTIEATGALNGVIFTVLGAFTAQLSAINSVQPIFEKFQSYQTMKRDKPLVIDNQQSEVFRLENVSFGYGEVPILRNVDYTFHKNKKYAIIGQSGSGKSTLLKLMFGYLSGYQGQIYFNHQLLTPTNHLHVRESVLYINQESYLFAGTIRDNILLDDNFDDAQILAILHELSFPISLADLDMQVGDRGLNLSGGQRQRIVLARGIIRQQNIIFIDEGTSALDQAAAIQIEKYLLQNPQFTVIIVTHHLHPAIQNYFDEQLQFPADFNRGE